jgi:hypothetical protein
MPVAVRSQLALPGAPAKVRVQRLARRCPLEPYELKIAEVLERWQKISKAFDERIGGPPSPSQQLSKLIEEGAGLDEAPDAMVHARAPAPATKTRRGRRPIHDWPRIERLDAEFCRTYCAKTGRPPSWKERRAVLAEKLGTDLKTLQWRLPKIALLKERNSRSI